MAQFVIPIKDDALKTEIEQAFSGAFANAEALTNEELVILHVSNYIRQVLNNARIQNAIAVAKESTPTLDSLE